MLLLLLPQCLNSLGSNWGISPRCETPPWREEIRKAKAQLELRLTTIIRDNKKRFYKYINNKKRAKENLHLLLDAGGNIATKDENKAEVLNAFFVSVFNS